MTLHPLGDEIAAAIDRLEAEHDVRVLYAAESGSRAWGFASPDSDFDVRFIYVHKLDWYLQIGDPRDVVEAMLPHDLDLSGWELRKALRLLAKGNVPLCEWLDSPIVYREQPAFAARLRALAPRWFDPAHALFHYLNTAKSTHRAHLAQLEVRLKKVFYALRPLLACRWIEHARAQPPTAFQRLVDAAWVTDAERAMIAGLQIAKAAASEADRAPLAPPVAAWLTGEMERYEKIGASFARPRERDCSDLDALLRDWVV